MSGVERWRTIARIDPDFLAYLDGSFSKHHVALPVRSLNVGTVSEEVTFEIVALDAVNAPPLWQSVWQIIRPRSLIFSGGPMIATLLFALAKGLPVSFAIAVSSFCGVLLFHIALNLFNDYGDHMKGSDRIRPYAGSRIIQRGWVRAASVRRAAWVCGGAAALCGLPAVVMHSGPAAITAGLAALFGLEFAFQKLRLRYRGWAEVIAFLLTGPLLTCGFAWAISGNANWAEAALGCVYGSIALMYFHSANLENIMTDAQVGVRTWATRTGFDASKKFFHFTTFLTFLSAAVYVLFFDREILLVPVVLVLGASLYGVSLRVQRLASPLSSELVGLREAAVVQSWVATAAFAGAYLAVLLSEFVR